jgi:DNA-binding MarR family transcriptional regulator
MLSRIGPVNSKTIRKLKSQRKSSTNSYPPLPVGQTGKPDELRGWIRHQERRSYAVELKRAPESRRDRVVPSLAEATLQAQALLATSLQSPLAIIASPLLSSAVFDQALEFQQAYASDVAVGFFDDRGFRVFRAPGLESLNSSPPEIRQRQSPIPESHSYSLFSDLGQWMIKVLLAQHIEPRFLRAPRLKIHNASELALAAGVSQVSASRLVRQLEAEGFLDRYADQLQLVRIQDLLKEWQAAVRRAFKEISCRWVIPGHGPKQFESALRDYQARQLRQASPEISGNGNSPRVCLGLFAAAEALGLEALCTEFRRCSMSSALSLN